MPVEIHRVREGAEVLVGVDNPHTVTVSAYLLTSAGRPNTAIIPRQQTLSVRTGFAFRAFPNYAILIIPRPSLSLQGIFVVDHQQGEAHELEIILYNGTHESRFIPHNMRVAQVLVVQAPEADNYRHVVITGI